MSRVKQLREQAGVLRSLAGSFTNFRIRDQLILIAARSARSGAREQALSEGARTAIGGARRSICGSLNRCSFVFTEVAGTIRLTYQNTKACQRDRSRRSRGITVTASGTFSK
jgi:hypothetical protein